jgi:hypothetical protein
MNLRSVGGKQGIWQCDGLGAAATAARTLGLILPEFVADLFRKDAERGSK